MIAGLANITDRGPWSVSNVPSQSRAEKKQKKTASGHCEMEMKAVTLDVFRCSLPGNGAQHDQQAASA